MTATTKPRLCRTPSQTTPLARIPEALRGIWRSCRGDGDDDVEVARSLAINFVGVAAADDEAELRAAVDRLHRRTPCRAFLLLVDEHADAVHAEVAAATRLAPGRQDILVEEIVLRLPADRFDHVPGLVRPLLVNDLPIHLFWAADWPRTEPAFDDLAALCDHVIVDTRRFASPAVQLAHLTRRREAGMRLTDLTWLRLRPWRRALAEAYERASQAVGRPTRVRIVHGTAALAAAMLLGEWLTARLTAEVALEGSGDGDAACPERVVVTAGDTEIDAEAPAGQIVVHVTTAAHCLLPFRVPTSRGADGDLVAAAIDLG